MLAMHATHLQIQTKAEIEPCMCEWLPGLSVADLNLLWGPGKAKPLLHHYLGRCGFSVPVPCGGGMWDSA